MHDLRNLISASAKLDKQAKLNIMRAMMSIMSGSHKTTVSIKPSDISAREGLAAGFSWDKSTKTWYITKNAKIIASCKKHCMHRSDFWKFREYMFHLPSLSSSFLGGTAAGLFSSGLTRGWKKPVKARYYKDAATVSW